MTPSANCATSAAWAPFETPSPTQTADAGDTRSNPSYQGARGCPDRVPRSGHAHRGRGVDEATAGGRGAGQPGIGRRRRDEKDPVETVLVAGREPWCGLIRYEVRSDRTRSAGAGEVGGEAGDPVAFDRIPVRHHHRRRARVGHRTDRAKHVGHAHAGSHRRVHGRLDRRAVHAGVAVGHPDLDDVDSGGDHRAHRLDRRVDVRIADRKVANQGRSTIGVRDRDRRGERTDRTSRRARRRAEAHPAGSRVDEIEVARRGLDVLVAAAGQVDQDDRLRASSRPSCCAPASAWADSIAGMMPSVRHSSRRRPSPAASVIGRYSARPMSCR